MHHQMESFLIIHVEMSTEVSAALNATLDLPWKDPIRGNVRKKTAMICTGPVPQQDAKVRNLFKWWHFKRMILLLW